jgi:hypothetical protein
VSISQDNLKRIIAVSDIHTNVLRAIGAGSPKLFQKLQAEQCTMASGYVANRFELENPDDRFLSMYTESVIKNPEYGYSMTLESSVQREPTSSFVRITYASPASESSGHGPLSMSLTCVPTESDGPQWSMEIAESDLMQFVRAFVEDMSGKGVKFDNKDVLTLIRNMAREHEQYF